MLGSCQQWVDRASRAGVQATEVSVDGEEKKIQHPELPGGRGTCREPRKGRRERRGKIRRENRAGEGGRGAGGGKELGSPA